MKVPSPLLSDRSRRLRRRFKLAILALTALGVGGMVGGTRAGRYGLAWLTNRAWWKAESLIGIRPPRADIDEEWRLRRALGVEQTGRIYRAFYEKEASPAWRGILKASGMAPEDVLLRWANYDWTVVFSSKVFEADDTGRSYRMKPNTRAFWTRNHSLPHGLSSFFFLPDIPEVRQALVEAREEPMPESFQTTNSWGCRGPEFDPTAEVRGLIVGDSFMQGLFVADDRTPPECLARELREVWARTVSILNTGHIGYSPEQYYRTLLEYFPRVHPRFVVLSVCPNDFGRADEVLMGRGDYDEASYWIGEIQQYCRTRQVPCLVVPAPFESQVVGRVNQGNYPGQFANISESNAFAYLNPVEAFTDEHLRLRREASPSGKPIAHSPLFNGHLEDAHFSALGSALWGRLVARRLGLIVEMPPGLGDKAGR